MTGTIDSRLAELGIELPEASAPAANYVPYVVSGNSVYISGQVPVHLLIDPPLPRVLVGAG